MTQTIVLIDYENVGAAGLENLPAQCRVILFLGRTQVLPKNSDIEKLLDGGKRVEFIKMAGLGKDNLDHHLALYLGKTIALEPHASYIIISNDKSGFDPLAKHVNDVLGISCKRITPVKQPAAKPSTNTAAKKATASPVKAASKKPPTVNEAALFLKKDPHPPTKRDKVLHHLVHHFTLTEAKAVELLMNLESAGHLKIGTAGKITYSP